MRATGTRISSTARVGDVRRALPGQLDRPPGAPSRRRRPRFDAFPRILRRRYSQTAHAPGPLSGAEEFLAVRWNSSTRLVFLSDREQFPPLTRRGCSPHPLLLFEAPPPRWRFLFVMGFSARGWKRRLTSRGAFGCGSYRWANHASTRTTQLYDRRRNEFSLDEVERIVI
jgi:hypothetical protein